MTVFRTFDDVHKMMGDPVENQPPDPDRLARLYRNIALDLLAGVRCLWHARPRTRWEQTRAYFEADENIIGIVSRRRASNMQVMCVAAWLARALAGRAGNGRWDDGQCRRNLQAARQCITWGLAPEPDDGEWRQYCADPPPDPVDRGPRDPTITPAAARTMATIVRMAGPDRTDAEMQRIAEAWLGSHADLPGARPGTMADSMTFLYMETAAELLQLFAGLDPNPEAFLNQITLELLELELAERAQPQGEDDQ